jgi:hypothetical protein
MVVTAVPRTALVWLSRSAPRAARTRYSRYPKTTFRKDRRLNIRLLSKNLEAIQKRALVAIGVKCRAAKNLRTTVA